jgi:hypothetical protein
MDSLPPAKKGPERQTGPIGGTPESAAWFRAALEEIGETQHGFAKWMKRLGDDRCVDTIRRNIQRMAKGEARVSGEMRVILTIRRNRAKSAAKAGAGGT